MNQPPLNPDALDSLIEQVQEAIDHVHLDPREFFDLSDVLYHLKAAALPEVTNVEELEAAIKRASTRAFDFMDQTSRGEFATDGELFEYAFACGVDAVREEAGLPEVKP